MPRHQILMGIAVAAISLLGLCNGRWFLENTKKGQRLIGWFGPDRAILVLRGLFLLAMVLGILLAADVIRPVRW